MEEPKPFPGSRKRPLEHVAAHTRNSPQYKMRAVLRDLRPHFVEVLKTPDFQNCKAATEIREGMKLLVDLYKDMTEQSTKLEKCSKSDIDNGQKPLEHQEDVKPAVKHSQNGESTKPSDTQVEGTYIVGVLLLVGTSSHSAVPKLSITGEQKRIFEPQTPSLTEQGGGCPLLTHLASYS
ncbi:UNVERIFIED_CONTAM: hypothetical protein Sangu_0017300 [Sesamum angustifolium]|uniref:Uncharacterized protein n=1 Tax=Sesamum angustifolium TaxID=2727405 RepID=A0AAW2RGM7_9LAMI